MKCIDGTVEIEVDQYTLTEDLDYDAISYVWGSAPVFVTVKCNGRPLIVTSTALQMLHYLHRYQTNTSARKIWVDAICINQEDQKEKSTQIPLMRDIYSQAGAVVVWIGPSTPETDVFFAEFQEVRDKSERWIAKHTADPDCPDPSREELPYLGEAFWGGLGQIFDNDWFRRLWTYQEIILPRIATLLCGNSWVDFDEFLKFFIDGWYNNSYILPKAPTLRRNTSPTTTFDGCQGIQFHRNRKAKDRLAIPLRSSDVALDLHELSSRHVKEPVDRVWAITGLLENGFRDRLISGIDYCAQGRKQYWKTWIMFAKALINENGGIKLLQIPPTLEPRPSSLPSWCPSLSGTPVVQMVIDGEWNRRMELQTKTIRWALSEEDSEEKSRKRVQAIRNHDKISVDTVGHDNTLHVRGFVVDTIEEIVEHKNPFKAYATYDANSEDQMVLYDIAVDCHMRSLDLARLVFYEKSEGITDIPEDFIVSFFLDCRITEGAKNIYRKFLPKLTTRYSPSSDWNLEESRCQSLLTSIRGHTFFSTKGRRIGYAYPGCQPGDQVAVFYGGEALYIIRQLDTASNGSDSTEEASDHVQYCSAAFVPHLMEQDERDAAHIGPDTTFIIH
jgi:hypothetical protein